MNALSFQSEPQTPQLTAVAAATSSSSSDSPTATTEEESLRWRPWREPVAKAGFYTSNTAQQAPSAPHFSHLSSQTRYPPQQPPYQQPPYQQYQQYQQPPLEPYGGGASTAAAQNPASIQKLREAMMETLMRRK
eukprot:gene10882-7742_t